MGEKTTEGSSQDTEYKMHVSWLIIMALTTWWWLGVITMGLFILWTIQYYRSYKVTLSGGTLTVQSGAFIKRIDSMRVNNASIVQYVPLLATVIVNTGNDNNKLTMAFVSDARSLYTSIKRLSS